MFPIVPGHSQAAKHCGNIIGMAGKADPVSYFGRQVKKERTARGWGLAELSQRTGIDAGHLSRIERGLRPPTEAVAKSCDDAFPERRGWFTEYYAESKSWVPVFFRDWPEIENKAASLRVWMPGIFHGLLQSSDYARALLATAPGVTDEIVSARLASRMERQQRVLGRDLPPVATFVIDETALLREVGTPQVMTAQLQHVVGMAALPHVTVQVLPSIAHPATASGFIIADDSAWCEHVASGGVYSADTVSGLARMFDTLRTETYRGSESLRLLERLADRWMTGGSPLTALLMAGTA